MIEINLGRAMKVKVTSINEYANKETAADTYQVLEG